MTNRGKLYDLEDALEFLLGYQVLFVGEEHGSRVCHDAELTLLKRLSELDPNLALALEMFECDVQEALDAYLERKISEKTFLEQSRPWPNYPEDYRPLIEYANRKRIPVIAANVPRRAAAAVARADNLSAEVLEGDQIYWPKRIHLESKEYYERFSANLEAMPSGAPMRGMDTNGLYKAQVLKDAVMAASLEPFLKHRVLFCCGHFHSDYHLGIPYQLQENHPEIKVAVITFASSVESLPMKERSQIGDFIWVEE